MAKLIAIDGNSLMHRAFYALPAMTNREGTPTGAIYGFLSMLLKLAQQEPEIKLPKTISSIRQIAIPQALCDILQELKKEQDRKKALLGEKWHEEGFLFTDWCGHVMHPHTPTKQFDKFLKKYGFRHLKFHGLRHSSATYLLSNGCDIKTVSKRLGHTSIDTTNIYVHALERTDKAAAECFDSIEV